MKNVMIDLETMSKTSNAAIVAIGAVVFDKNDGLTDEFYRTVDLDSCIKKGFTVDGSTVCWWLKQSDEARKGLLIDNVLIRDALSDFKDWFPRGNVQVWGNGSDFDNVILSNAFGMFNAQPPWKYFNSRCYRTIKCSYPNAELDRPGVHHNALDDAKFQAQHLIEIVKRQKLRDLI